VERLSTDLRTVRQPSAAQCSMSVQAPVVTLYSLCYLVRSWGLASALLWMACGGHQQHRHRVRLPISGTEAA